MVGVTESVRASAARRGSEPASEPVHRALGLTDGELERIVELLGRAPNHLELAMFSVMWSEHCSYKSSRVHLGRLPTTGPGVLVGPGENAGVVDAGDGIAVAIRIESHNHPSAIEPTQGAATGVGGILRDIFTMGARPLAVMDPLFFGPIDGERPATGEDDGPARQRWLCEGVVAGIAGYGNSVGVPTVGGELTFHASYAGNPLVNVLCLGALPVERLVLGRATGPGNLAVLLGSPTGRDGIGGVSVLASAGFSGDRSGAADDAKRPSVQVGDPFEEKRLIEACLDLLDRHLVVGIQDLGGAGLACATSETAARGGVGMDVDVTAVPRREPAMAPWEVMVSESQERMLAIVSPANLGAVMDLCRRWEVRSTVIGRVTEPGLLPDGTAVGRLRILDGFDGEVLADVPARALTDDAPRYHRPMAPPPGGPGGGGPGGRPGRPGGGRPGGPEPGTGDRSPADVLASLLVDPGWVYRQYDHQLFLNTVVGPGGDAALLRLRGPGLPRSDRGIAVTTDSAPRWCALDPRRGTAMVVAEAVANLACVGARAVAVVNCLNFGNPEHPEVMWQLSEAVDGMSEACRALGAPVIGGNVSLYNESDGEDILPTPVVGALGFVGRLVARPPGIRWRAGDALVLLGSRSVAGTSAAERHPLDGSRWAVEAHGRDGGSLAELDLPAHRRIVELVADMVAAQVGGAPEVLSGVHDVSGGGLAVCLAEMAVGAATSELGQGGGEGAGCRVEGVDGHHELFTELPSRVLVAAADPAPVLARAREAGVAAAVIGRAGGHRLVVDGLLDLSVEEVSERARGRLAALLGAGAPPVG